MNSQPIKASSAKGLRAKIVEQMPGIEPFIEEIWPKKAKVYQMRFKGENQITFIVIEDQIMFLELNHRNIMPMLKLLHKYPMILPHMVCDKGAIRHIFSGSDVMAPGLTSEGGNIDLSVPEGGAVAIMAEGKVHAMGVGLMKQSGEDVKATGKGVAIESIQFLNDQLWKEVYPN
tara:strand:- start:67 stop:588 length:522 start_codon:yes stop_codon:yes gene_type:complete